MQVWGVGVGLCFLLESLWVVGWMMPCGLCVERLKILLPGDGFVPGGG